MKITQTGGFEFTVNKKEKKKKKINIAAVVNVCFDLKQSSVLLFCFFLWAQMLIIEEIALSEIRAG